MTTKPSYELFVGKTGIHLTNGLDIPVNILDYRYVFGRDDLEIQAVGGTKTKWVSADSVTVNQGEV